MYYIYRPNIYGIIKGNSEKINDGEKQFVQICLNPIWKLFKFTIFATARTTLFYRASS